MFGPRPIRLNASRCVGDRFPREINLCLGDKVGVAFKLQLRSYDVHRDDRRQILPAGIQREIHQVLQIRDGEMAIDSCGSLRIVQVGQGTVAADPRHRVRSPADHSVAPAEARHPA